VSNQVEIHPSLDFIRDAKLVLVFISTSSSTSTSTPTSHTVNDDNRARIRTVDAISLWLDREVQDREVQDRDHIDRGINYALVSC